MLIRDLNRVRELAREIAREEILKHIDEKHPAKSEDKSMTELIEKEKKEAIVKGAETTAKSIKVETADKKSDFKKSKK